MFNTNPPTQPSPDLIFSSINAFQRSALIRAAIELDIFTAIAEGKRTVQAIAGRCAAAERGVRILCDVLTCQGLLNKRGGDYELTADSATFLDRRSPAYCGSMVEFLMSADIMQMFDRLTDAVRQGGTAARDKGTVGVENSVWVKFARAMAPMMTPAAQRMSQLLLNGATPPMKVLDIAAGHGMFGISLGLANPNARIFAQDWKNVLEVAQENATRAGLGERFKTIPGSAFDVEFGGGFDLILLPNFLHHFDVPTCQSLLKKVRSNLAPGGRVAAIEFIPDEDRVGPAHSASFALVMLATTPGGDAYTYRELDDMFRAAGFGRTQLHAMPPLIQKMVVAGA
jgi:2-polyprenyl-3-methyl-5-hydroxy-6-metoxy-1,4-benzoquinol methylase